MYATCVHVCVYGICMVMSMSVWVYVLYMCVFGCMCMCTKPRYMHIIKNKKIMEPILKRVVIVTKSLFEKVVFNAQLVN